jgi:hypothetical protein
MNAMIKRDSPWVFLAAGLAMGLSVALGVWLGRSPAPSLQVPESLLHAAGASSNDAFSCCTGVLDDGEGLFVLDNLTGELNCFAVHPRVRQIRGKFTANVTQALGADPQKKPRYLMVAGNMNFQRGGGATRPASCAVYVIDGNTGNFAIYLVPWNPNLWNNNQPMALPLQLMETGTARSVQIGQ